MIRVQNNDVLIDSTDILKDIYYLLVTLNNIGINMDQVYFAYKNGELAKRYPEQLYRIKGNIDSVCAIYKDGEIHFIGGK